MDEILAAREDRARRQGEMLSHGLPLLSFTLNTPGDIKDSPAIRRFFAVWLDRIREALGGKIVKEEARYPKTGPEYLAALRGDAGEIKRICVAIEESRPAGRLLDLDVIGTEGTSLSRTGLGFPERKCLICGKPGRACGAGQRHSYKALTEKAGALIRGYLVERDAERLGEKATNALIREVHVTPKPGLVDENNNGSHRDMDLPLM
ncbi:MAG: citrate lyase holo-[acyl-carrier protein] synthase, partial [Clostridia bacterium]|nr:citrate lyase holo-[acyl-carrier protein] synthase [Clostridia bacterium]